MTVLLIGPRGSGKSSVGRLLAETHGMRFVDLDERVLARFEEESVRDVWCLHGEEAWRAGEVAALQELLTEAGEPSVVALGGGTPVIGAARRVIDRARRAARVRVVYLRCTVPVLAERLAGGGGDRPSLTGEDVVDEIQAVLEARAAVYEDLADVVHDNDRDDVRGAVMALGRLLRLDELPPGSGSDA